MKPRFSSPAPNKRRVSTLPNVPWEGSSPIQNLKTIRQGWVFPADWLLHSSTVHPLLGSGPEDVPWHTGPLLNTPAGGPELSDKVCSACHILPIFHLQIKQPVGKHRIFTLLGRASHCNILLEKGFRYPLEMFWRSLYDTDAEKTTRSISNPQLC